ncbi:hypothetical protein B0H13DRAFT_1875019 [Mycena leptocephala]|nr:hypothetical protein B0H13DRAFT_1875019 [Mycena leptocephala]
MSAPNKRTRVYLACLLCRKRKIKCMTDDSGENPCARCFRKGLRCEYIPVAVQKEQSVPMPASGGSGTAHLGPPTPVASIPYLSPENCFLPRAGSAQYLPSISRISASSPFDVTTRSTKVPPSHGAVQTYPAPGLYCAPSQIYNTNGLTPASPYGADAPPHQQYSFSESAKSGYLESTTFYKPKKFTAPYWYVSKSFSEFSPAY